MNQDIANLIIISMLGILLCAGILALFNKHLPKWFCRGLGWHLEPTDKESDGCTAIGQCPRCGKRVGQDSQGNWFAMENQS